MEITGIELNEKINDAIKRGNDIYHENLHCTDDLAVEISYGNLKIKDSTFSGQIDFSNYGSKVHIHFSNCKFEKCILFSSVSSDSRISFRKCEFHEGMQMIFIENVELIILESRYSDILNFSNSKFTKIHWSQVVSLDNNSSTSVNFDNVEFNQNSFLDSVLCNSSFNGSLFTTNANFNKSTFSSDRKSKGTHFNLVTFSQDVFFEQTIFSGNVHFNNIKFLGGAYFSNINTNQQYGAAIFFSSQFSKRVYFSDSALTKLNLYGNDFKDVVSFANFKCQFLTIDKCIFQQGADFLFAEVEDGTREAFRCIKNEFLKNNNVIEAQKYQSKELRVYEKDLPLIGNIKEKVVLWLNKKSNDFGANWVRGVLFTLFVSIIFYTAYIFTLEQALWKWGWINWGSFSSVIDVVMKNYFKFFILTHDIDFLKNNKPTALSYFIDSFARIIIGYGIYQTVVAFRKYGK